MSSLQLSSVLQQCLQDVNAVAVEHKSGGKATAINNALY